MHMWENEVLYLKNSWGKESGYQGEFRLHESMLQLPNSQFNFVIIDVDDSPGSALPAVIRNNIQTYKPVDKNWIPFIPLLKRSTVSNEDQAMQQNIAGAADTVVDVDVEIDFKSEHLGEGNSSIVYKGFLTTGCPETSLPSADAAVEPKEVAIKILHVPNNEVSKLLYRIYDFRHENLVRYRGLWCEFNANKVLKRSQVCIVMDREHVTLTKMLQNRGTAKAVAWSQFFDIVLDVASGLQYMHRHGFTHHDVCSDNIMLGFDGRFRLTDFWNVVSKDTATRTPGTGHPKWVEHEAFFKRMYMEVDIFSMGKLMLYLLLGDEGLELREYSDRVHPYIWRLYSECTAAPAARPTIDQLIQRLQDLEKSGMPKVVAPPPSASKTAVPHAVAKTPPPPAVAARPAKEAAVTTSPAASTSSSDGGGGWLMPVLIVGAILIGGYFLFGGGGSSDEVS